MCELKDALFLAAVLIVYGLQSHLDFEDAKIQHTNVQKSTSKACPNATRADAHQVLAFDAEVPDSPASAMQVTPCAAGSR